VIGIVMVGVALWPSLRGGKNRGESDKDH